jgi:hypothetical protein
LEKKELVEQSHIYSRGLNDFYNTELGNEKGESGRKSADI